MCIELFLQHNEQTTYVYSTTEQGAALSVYFDDWLIDSETLIVFMLEGTKVATCEGQNGKTLVEQLSQLQKPAQKASSQSDSDPFFKGLSPVTEA